jgi:hypothetical protein
LIHGPPRFRMGRSKWPIVEIQIAYGKKHPF